jgi:hypothetical protein
VTPEHPNQTLPGHNDRADRSVSRIGQKMVQGRAGIMRADGDRLSDAEGDHAFMVPPDVDDRVKPDEEAFTVPSHRGGKPGGTP